MEKKRYPEFRETLLRWFEEEQRPLPWRRDYAPYRVWISEIMLQQTRVKTVLPYYERWMERFPDVRSLAGADEEEILRYWEGMGYYSRARNILRTARILVHELGGELPREHGAIGKLPGIGPYTAGAIMSLAFNEDYPLVDGNVERVLARLFNIETPIREKATRALIWKTAGELIPSGRARRFNQALMELGAILCLPRLPSCPQCPVRPFCQSFHSSVVDQRPVKSVRKPASALEVVVGILVHNEKIFIQKRPPGGLMPHLWEFPGGKVKNGETHEEALVRELLEELELEIRCIKKITLIRHSYTSFRVSLHAFLCRLDGSDQEPVPHAAVDARWVSPDQLGNHAFPAANRKLIRLLLEMDLAMD